MYKEELGSQGKKNVRYEAKIVATEIENSVRKKNEKNFY